MHSLKLETNAICCACGDGLCAICVANRGTFKSSDQRQSLLKFTATESSAFSAEEPMPQVPRNVLKILVVVICHWNLISAYAVFSKRGW